MIYAWQNFLPGNQRDQIYLLPEIIFSSLSINSKALAFFILLMTKVSFLLLTVIAEEKEHTLYIIYQNWGHAQFTLGNYDRAKELCYQSLEINQGGSNFYTPLNFNILYSILETEGDYQEIVRLQKIKNEQLEIISQNSNEIQEIDSKLNLMLLEKELTSQAQFSYSSAQSNQLTDIIWGISFLLVLFSLLFFK